MFVSIRLHLRIAHEAVWLPSFCDFPTFGAGTASQYGHGESGPEGDNRYMAPELLEDSTKTPVCFL